MRDDIVRRIEQRASTIIGWRNNSTTIQRFNVQKYGFNGYYSFHYDWDGRSQEGNRMTTFLVYLNDNYTGGGTNFPRLEQPADQRWCSVILCNGDHDYEEYPGETFRPVAGSAVYWENFHPSGTPHTGTGTLAFQSRLERLGLNILSWNASWRPQGENAA